MSARFAAWRTHQVVDAVSGISPDDAEALWLDDLLDLVADLSVRHPRLADGDRFVHCLFRRGDELRGLGGNLANWVCGVHITVEATVI